MASLSSEFLRSLADFDIRQLGDLGNAAVWPMPVKVFIWITAFLLTLVAGYLLHVTGLQERLGKAQAAEAMLRRDYESQFAQAVHLDAYRAQGARMQAAFEAMLGQLPSDTEIPGLIEDITRSGLANGVAFESIDLQPEIRHEFYVERPIRIVLGGDYHGFGSFVSDVALLPRIVTLHDFKIAPERRARSAGGGRLRMEILARIYRYNDERGLHEGEGGEMK